MSKEKAYEYKTAMIEGAKHHLVRYEKDGNWKLHSWDGPAIIPKKMDCQLKKSWFINGFEYTKDEWDERLRERQGLPPSKQTSVEEVK